MPLDVPGTDFANFVGYILWSIWMLAFATLIWQRPARDPCATAGMSLGVAIALGAVIGLALGILVSVTTDLPLAPEVGAVLGGLIGWLSRRNPA